MRLAVGASRLASLDAPLSTRDESGDGGLADTLLPDILTFDTAKSDAGLYILFEFPTRRDYDLELLWPDSSYAARSHDFNLIYSPAGVHATGGHGGEATDTSEKIVGVRTPDCGGYTVEAVNWLGEGGDMDLLSSENLTSYIYTDRPIYRPAQKVNFKLWVERAQYDNDKRDFAATPPFGASTISP